MNGSTIKKAKSFRHAISKSFFGIKVSKFSNSFENFALLMFLVNFNCRLDS